MNNEELVRRYFEAVARFDFDAMEQLRHRDWHEDWPQSGERVPNHEAYRKIHEDFHGGIPRVDVQRLAGAEDRWVMTPAMTIERIAGSGDVWYGVTLNAYPNGDVYHVVQLVTLRDGRVWRSTTYFAPPFEAPAWRASLVVPID